MIQKEHLFRVIQNGKAGFINKKGEIVIESKFDAASQFSEGMARVYFNDKVGFIDSTGKVIVPVKYDKAFDYREGIAVVEIDGKQGYIDIVGDFIIDPVFYKAYDFNDGYAKVFRDIYSRGAFIDKSGKILLEGEDFYNSVYSEGLINFKGKENSGYIDIFGDFVIPPVYGTTLPFYERKAAVQISKTVALGAKSLFGFLNPSGELIIPYKFDGADLRFSENRCAVWDEQYGYINEIGDLIIPYQFELGDHFSEGLARILSSGGKYGFIDLDGRNVIPPKFDSAESFHNGLAAVYFGNEFNNTSCGYIDGNGDFVWEPSK